MAGSPASAQSSEFSTFAFYIPVLFVMVGVSSILGTNLVTMALYIIAAISGWVGPLITPKIGHRGIGIAGFGIVFVSLLVAAWALYTGTTYILPFAAAAMLWGHYWDASNVMTIPSMVARPQYRGTASGFAYMFVKLPSFLAIFLFPSLFARDRPGQRHAVRRDLPADRPAVGDLHPAGGLRLRIRLIPPETNPLPLAGEGG